MAAFEAAAKARKAALFSSGLMSWVRSFSSSGARPAEGRTSRVTLPCALIEEVTLALVWRP